MEQGESVTPQFIRDFSKDQSPKEYQKTTQAISDKRQEFHKQRKERSENQDNLQNSTCETELSLNQTLTDLDNLQKHINELSTSGFKKLINYFRLKKIQADIAISQSKFDEFKKQKDSETSKQEENSKLLKTPPELQDAKKVLNAFYQDQEKKWADSNYSKEDIKRYFTEKYLSSLSLRDYVLLLKRFPSEMVTHVTRQGIRDHAGMSFHTVGLERYSDGFMKIIESQRLQSTLAIYLTEREKKQAISELLQLGATPNKQDALEHLQMMTDQERQFEAGSYVDRTSIHFATEDVLNCYYGSETRNEIFIVFPSVYIASQYYFSGQLEKGNPSYWNDQWVWANEEKGLNINAGIIFIPKNTKVDKETGSRYQIDQNKNPIKNSEYIIKLKEIIHSDDFLVLLQEIKDGDIENLQQRFKQKFGIEDPKLLKTVLDYNSVFAFNIHRQNKEELHQEIEKALRKFGILYLESQNTITSEEFWENYFNQKPEKRPSKIVYYSEEDPTEALKYWKKRQGLDKSTESEDMGFQEQSISRNDPRLTTNMDHFKTLAEEVINEFYSTN